MTLSHVDPHTPPNIVVVIPCLNEESAIGSVVRAFRTVLPRARVIVVDNASTDKTAEEARAAGAEVIRETRRGKGFALLTGVRASAPMDVVVMIDGDGTYAPEDAPRLLECIASGADMAIGTRLQSSPSSAFPTGHSVGNHAFNFVVRVLFGIRTRDLFSGYRALTSRLLEQCPLIAQGFEIEAELSIQASVNRYRVDEVPVDYRARLGNGVSKLRTVRDGYRILIAILTFFRDYRPLAFFGTAGLLLMAGSLSAGTLVVSQYLETGLVLRVPLAIGAVGLFILAALSMTAGVLLSSINRRAEEIRSLLVSRRA